jgi:hypothetical protein
MDMKRREVVKRILDGGGKLVRKGKRHDIYQGPNGEYDEIKRHNEFDNITAQKIFKHLGV